MQQSIVRIELHGANSRDYQQLHDAAALEGLVDDVRFNGAECKLPTGTYMYEGAINANQLLDKALKAANKTDKTSSILVNANNALAAHNLQSFHNSRGLAAHW